MANPSLEAGALNAAVLTVLLCSTSALAREGPQRLLPGRAWAAEAAAGSQAWQDSVGLHGTLELIAALDLRLGFGVHFVSDVEPVGSAREAWASGEDPKLRWTPYGSLSTHNHIGWLFPMGHPAALGPLLSFDTLHVLRRHDGEALYLEEAAGCLGLGSWGSGMVARWHTRDALFTAAGGLSRSCNFVSPVYRPRLDLRVHNQAGWTYGFVLDPHTTMLRVGRGRAQPAW